MFTRDSSKSFLLRLIYCVKVDDLLKVNNREKAVSGWGGGGNPRLIISWIWKGKSTFTPSGNTRLLLVANVLDFKWDLKFRSPTIWNMYKWAPFCQKPFEIWTKMSRFWMVGTIAIAIAKVRLFENRTIWNPTLKKSRFQMFPVVKWSDFRSLLYCGFESCLSSVELTYNKH